MSKGPHHAVDTRNIDGPRRAEQIAFDVSGLVTHGIRSRSWLRYRRTISQNSRPDSPHQNNFDAGGDDSAPRRSRGRGSFCAHLVIVAAFRVKPPAGVVGDNRVIGLRHDHRLENYGKLR